MGGDAGPMLANVAGRVLGVLSALRSRGGGFGNLANYMAARGRAMSDPNARAALTPFGAGFYQIGGGMQPGPAGPATIGGVAAPSDFMGPTIPTLVGPAQSLFVQPGQPGRSVWKADLPALAPAGAGEPGAEERAPPLAGRAQSLCVPPGRPARSVWKAALPALAPEAAVEQAAQERIRLDLQSPDTATRARAKKAAKIPLTPGDNQALIAGHKRFLTHRPPSRNSLHRAGRGALLSRQPVPARHVPDARGRHAAGPPAARAGAWRRPQAGRGARTRRASYTRRGRS